MTSPELAEAVRSRGPAWFPGLARELERRFWSEERQLAPASYCTGAWLHGVDASEATRSAGTLVIGRRRVAVEIADRGTAARLGRNGLRPVGAAEVATAMATLNEAFGLVGSAPTLAASISTLVRSVQVLESAGLGYDTSHSDPAIPFSIFVSVPCGEPQAGLRVAESVVHEAMHLQLSLIERWLPLVDAGTEAELFSPWQGRERPVSGLLHGLYVFRVIDDWYADMSMHRLSERDRAFVGRRRGEIAAEIASVADLGAQPGLTDEGTQLVSRLLGAGTAIDPRSPASSR